MGGGGGGLRGEGTRGLDGRGRIHCIALKMEYSDDS